MRRLCGRTFRGHVCLDGYHHQPDGIPPWEARGPQRTLVIPPSTTKSWPFTKLLSSLARNKTAWACSIASPNRPVGKWISRRWRFAASSPSQSCRRAVLARMSALPVECSRKLSIKECEFGLLQRCRAQSIKPKTLPRMYDGQFPRQGQNRAFAGSISQLRCRTAH